MKLGTGRYWAPLLIGGAAGALYAWFSVESPKREATALNTVVASATVRTSLSPALPTASGSADFAASAPSSALTAPLASAEPPPTPSAAQAPSAMPPAPPVRPAFDLTPPKSAEELLAVQVRCNNKSPEDCERAAPALEAGTFGAPDRARAKSLRSIALTLYVKQCESKRAAACARLAEMYERGETVKQSERSAQALRIRVNELCALPSNDPTKSTVCP